MADLVQPPLLLSGADLIALGALVERAATNVVPYARVLELVAPWNAGMRGWASNARQTVRVGPLAVTLTHGEQRPGLVCRHLSVSREGARCPTAYDVVTITRLTGFMNPLRAVPSWWERIEPGVEAANVLEPLNGDLAKLARGGGRD